MKKFITAAIAVAALIAVSTTSSVQAGSYDPFAIRTNAYVAPNRIAYTKQCGPTGCYDVPVRNTAAAYPYASNSTLNCANGQCSPCANGQCVTPNRYGTTYNRFNQARRANTNVLVRKPAPVVHQHTTRYTPPARTNRTLLNPLGLNLFFK